MTALKESACIDQYAGIFSAACIAPESVKRMYAGCVLKVRIRYPESQCRNEECSRCLYMGTQLFIPIQPL